MPAYVASRIAEGLNERGKPLKGAKILGIGVAY
jgi:UDP-N-acetyl-D-glucosamine dehydrogenase